MGFGVASLAITCLYVVAINCVDANEQTSNSFLSSYDKQECICHKMGWEPKCKRSCSSGNLINTKYAAKILFFHLKSKHSHHHMYTKIGN